MSICEELDSGRRHWLLDDVNNGLLAVVLLVVFVDCVIFSEIEIEIWKSMCNCELNGFCGVIGGASAT